MKVITVSGGFDPLHIGHLRMFKEAKELGDHLLVIVNDDEFLCRKKGSNFMSLEDRVEIVKAVKYVDQVCVAIDDDNTVCKTLEKYKPDIFANGGDRQNMADIPEAEICRKLGIKMIFGIGGGKIRSSSELVEKQLGIQKQMSFNKS